MSKLADSSNARCARRVMLGMMLAIGAVPATATAGAVFTWDPAAVAPGEAGPEFTADTMYGGHYLWDYGPSAPPYIPVPGRTYLVDFYEQIRQVSLGGGAPFVPSGLNGTPGAAGSYGLYLKMHALTEQIGAPKYYKYLSMTMSLMLDPGNNDGTLSSTIPGVGFANGTAGDITLATGTLVSGAYILTNPASGIRSISQFRQTFLPAPGEAGFFVTPVSPDTILKEYLTTPISAFKRTVDPNDRSSQWSLLNNGQATIDLHVPEPASLPLLGAGLIGLVVLHPLRNLRRPR